MPVKRLHRRIGKSGGLFVSAPLPEIGGDLSSDQVPALSLAHNDAYTRRRDPVRPLPGARELLAKLTERQLKWAITTAEWRPRGPAEDARATEDTPVTRDQVRDAKPNPDVLLATPDRIDLDVTAAGLRRPVPGRGRAEDTAGNGH